MESTSLEAYKRIIPSLGKRHRQVFAAISHLKKPNNREISEFLQLPINSITPRVKELREQGMVTCGGQKEDSVTKSTTNWWKLI